MAYAFSQIDKLVGDEEQGSNIFGDQAQQTGISLQNPPGSEMVKTTTEGDIGGPSGGMSSQSGSSAPDEIKGYSPTPEDQSEVFRRNVGKTSTPRGLDRLSGQIEQNQAELQKRADDYMQQAKGQYQYDIGESSLEKAIGGGQQEYGQVAGLLGKQKADYRPEFEDVSDLYMGEKVRGLGTQAGIQKLAAEGQGPRYSSGMAAFDAMLMQRDPEFNKQIADIRAQQKELDKTLGGAEDIYEQKAQELGQTQLESAQQKAEDYLRNYRAGLEAQNVGEAEAYQKSLADLDREKIIADAYAQAQKTAGADLGQLYANRDYETSIAPFLQKAGAVPQEFDPLMLEYKTGETPRISFDPGQYTYKDFIDAQEADKFNRLMGLLGEGGDTYTAAGALGPQYTVDQAGLAGDILQQAAEARQAEDVAQQGRREDILSAAQARADADDARRLALREEFDPTIQALTEQYLKDNPDAAKYYNKDIMSGYQRPGEALDLGALDVLNQSEVDKLNAIAADLGATGNYQLGRGLGPEKLLNEQDYQDYLKGKINENKQASERARIVDLGGTPIVDENGNIVAAEGTPVGRSITGETVWAEPGREAEALVPTVGQTPIMNLPPDSVAAPAQFGGDIGKPASYVDIPATTGTPQVGQAIIPGPTPAPLPSVPLPVVGQTPITGDITPSVPAPDVGFGGAYDASSWNQPQTQERSAGYTPGSAWGIPGTSAAPAPIPSSGTSKSPNYDWQAIAQMLGGFSFF